ncbi:hypothetical protein CHLNCDRAFT_59044 [Chlorella variabilis]|uniref:Uncharacterized protein n=1 Tax=Chlorella variabilis TaxID=554065 RepID=E1ZQ66_CHLVA|nr:hypothetical protein CHLNCDRAFT_59044 [Chlorella variabilis]EFN51882.1 hypothetical protein CHLNCDRAFT_59044 [Chlorella variabilis]|eukprot:XP_005843984.1 hypothetical protein CHLNCDRAFT_59044 [Chlorella variabilis]
MQAVMLQPLRAQPLVPRVAGGRGAAALRLGGRPLHSSGARTGRAARQAQRRGLHRPGAVQSDDVATATLTAERSMLINKEVVLFLFQLEMDSQLQRALTYERFDMAQEVRGRREQVDAALRELQQLKGPGCGARVAGRSDQMHELAHGADQLFYHVLVDARDWPLDGDTPPVAYVAEECLTAGSSADFSSDQPLVDGSFEHPYSYLLFLGADGQGNMVPARQLRDKYCVGRRDVYVPGDSRWEEDEDEGEGGGSGGKGPEGPEPPRGEGGAGRRKIPGIDMSSLD